MQRVTIADTPRFRLESHGNGLAYVLTNKDAEEDKFFQGDDAFQFRQEFDEMETADPERQADTILEAL